MEFANAASEKDSLQCWLCEGDTALLARRISTVNRFPILPVWPQAVRRRAAGLTLAPFKVPASHAYCQNSFSVFFATFYAGSTYF